MSVRNFLIQRLTFFNRLYTKKTTIKTVINATQYNNGVINVHGIDLRNAGDYNCGPHLYFKKLNGKSLDISDYKRPDKTDNYIEKIVNNSIIIGGGGLLNRGSFERQMKMFEAIAQNGKKTVLWGLGHNEKDRATFGKVTRYNVDTSKFGLVGVRDYDMKEEWVPCVSCLHPIMDTKNTVINEVGLIYHKKTLKDKSLLKKLDSYPSTSNTINIEEIIDFISKTDTVVTDSYHAMYWSMLLGKKIVALPNSSKFYSFKYKPAFSDFKNFENEIKNAPRYTGVLEECREINLKFSEKVFDYLNL
ncbi:MAG TPA: polysaccharide pyruvyl transferase family protein [Flavobacterium sp.]|nr:polysaccharide pyruvyl transferase family protein [Flavobacterium sp.]